MGRTIIDPLTGADISYLELINTSGPEGVRGSRGVSGPPAIPPPEARLRKSDGKTTWNGHSHDTENHTKVRGMIVKELKTELSAYDFQFNPPEMSGSTGAEWKTYNGPGTFLPIASFMHMNTPSTSLNIFIDCSDPSKMKQQRMVSDQYMGAWADILTLLGFVNPDLRKQTYDTIYKPDTGRFVAPSPVIIVMGPVVLRTILNSVEWTISHWHANLVPMRATVALKFQEITSSLKRDFNRLQKTQNESSKRLTTLGYASLPAAAAAYGAENFFSPEG